MLRLCYYDKQIRAASASLQLPSILQQYFILLGALFSVLGRNLLLYVPFIFFISSCADLVVEVPSYKENGVHFKYFIFSYAAE